MPFALADVVRVIGRIISAEAYTMLRELADDETIPLDEDVRPRITAGRKVSAQAYLEALAQREAMKAQFAQAIDGIDALLTPTIGTAAIALSEVDQNGTPAHYTRFVNLLDLCALALPNGFTAGGLPLSLQIVCRGFDEAMAMRIGFAYQQATDWHMRRPAL